MRITSTPSSTTTTMPRIICLTALLLVVSPACGGEGFDEREATAVSAEPIKNGIYVGYKKGLLHLNVGGGWCTAAMIGRHWAITAAHCIRRTKGSPDADFVGTAYYFDPDTQTKRPVSDINERFRAHHVGTWDGPDGVDYQDDLAVFARKQYGWKSTDSSDYLALNAGLSLSDLEQYGAGYFSEDKKEFGVLRKRSVDPKDWDKHWFYDLEGTRGACRGDSGGPYINTVGDLLAISGIASSAELDGVCAESGGRQYAARVNSRVGWMINTLEMPCWHSQFEGWVVCNGHAEF